MSYALPFTITTDILNLVVDISQQVGRLDASKLNAVLKTTVTNNDRLRQDIDIITAEIEGA